MNCRWIFLCVLLCASRPSLAQELPCDDDKVIGWIDLDGRIVIHSFGSEEPGFVHTSLEISSAGGYLVPGGSAEPFDILFSSSTTQYAAAPALGVSEITLDDADLVTGASYDLARATLDGVNPADDLTLDVTCNFITTPVSTTLLGDANFDRTVDFFDFLVVARNFRRTDAVWPEGDFNFDRRVDLSDFLWISRNFNQSSEVTPMAAPAPVPEPGTNVMMAIALGALATCRRRRQA